jgi:hypothetical protein
MDMEETLNKPTRIRILKGDLSPVWEHTNEINPPVESWEGSVLFEAPANTDEDKLEFLAQSYALPFAEVSEWSIEIICPGMFKLTPREWETLPLERT